MPEARVLIDLQEGVIELEGPIEFVEKHMALFIPEMMGVEELEEEKPVVKRGRPAKAGKPKKKKRVSCDKIIDALAGEGFFAQPRGFGAIKQEVLKTDPGCSDNKIRQTLKKAIAGEKITASGAGRGMKYTQV
ncbi:hypothetical protein ABFB09_06135 [Dehalogenimonas sp. THU2]|uniref:hypothetical protein n=1 Tax=Dehalogenimonas sp. THU2 TaxID=3151121 RepID=UPI003218B803